jgi:RNase H-fold protein (predicted Holliday junction resolvase)
MSRPNSKLSTTILALDYGSKRVGVAIKASGTDQVEVVSTVDQDDQFWTSLRALLRRYQPDQIVLGWPRNAANIWDFMVTCAACFS